MNGLHLNLRCTGAQDFSLQVDCELPMSGVTAIYGPSGSGKTTLLHCIAGLRKSEAGALIQVGDQIWEGGGNQVPAWQREVGFVFNDARLFPHLSVRGNLSYAIKHSAREHFDLNTVVAWLELDSLLERMPDSLSAGQCQRVAIARALLRAPRILLLDEPFANLDSSTRRQCTRYLQRLAAELDIPVLFVSHDIEDVSELADYLVLLEEGAIRNQGPLLELCSRLDTGLSEEERAAAILQARIIGHDEAYALTELDVEGQTITVSALARTTGSGQRLRIPARDVSICRQRPLDSSILNILPVTIDAIGAPDSARLTLRLALGSQYLLARITRRSADTLNLQVGDQVFAQIKSVALLTGPAE